MKPAVFDMVRPATLDEALCLLAAHHEDARVIAGGQTLVPAMNFRLATPGLLIDLNRVSELATIRLDGSQLRIGAMTRQAALLTNLLVAKHVPLLGIAVPHIGHIQTRSRGTVGGSLAHADPSAELPLVMKTLGATFTLRSSTALRTLPAREFFLDALGTALVDGELLTEVAIPVAPEGTRCAFRELTRRHGDFAIVSVAVQHTPDAIVIGVGGLEGVPRLCTSLMNAILAPGFARSNLPDLIRTELQGARALADLHASADYRRHLAAVLLDECLDEVLA